MTGSAPPIEEFEVTKDFELLLSALQPNWIVHKYPKWEGGPTLIITLSDGEELRIDVYWPAKEPLGFKIDGTTYRGGSKNELDKALHYLAP